MSGEPHNTEPPPVTTTQGALSTPVEANKTSTGEYTEICTSWADLVEDELSSSEEKAALKMSLGPMFGTSDLKQGWGLNAITLIPRDLEQKLPRLYQYISIACRRAGVSLTASGLPLGDRFTVVGDYFKVDSGTTVGGLAEKYQDSDQMRKLVRNYEIFERLGRALLRFAIPNNRPTGKALLVYSAILTPVMRVYRRVKGLKPIPSSEYRLPFGTEVNVLSSAISNTFGDPEGERRLIALLVRCLNSIADVYGDNESNVWSTLTRRDLANLSWFTIKTNVEHQLRRETRVEEVATPAARKGSKAKTVTRKRIVTVTPIIQVSDDVMTPDDKRAATIANRTLAECREKFTLWRSNMVNQSRTIDQISLVDRVEWGRPVSVSDLDSVTVAMERIYGLVDTVNAEIASRKRTIRGYAVAYMRAANRGKLERQDFLAAVARYKAEPDREPLVLNIVRSIPKVMDSASFWSSFEEPLNEYLKSQHAPVEDEDIPGINDLPPLPKATVSLDMDTTD